MDSQGFSSDKSNFCMCAGRSRLFKMCLCIKNRFSLNLVPLYTTVSKNTVSVSDVLAVNLIVGGCKFACSMKASISGYLCPIFED